jgi:hypothetical protein
VLTSREYGERIKHMLKDTGVAPDALLQILDNPQAIVQMAQILGPPGGGQGQGQGQGRQAAIQHAKTPARQPTIRPTGPAPTSRGHTHTHTNTHTYTHTHARTHTQTNTHIYTHTHTHTQAMAAPPRWVDRHPPAVSTPLEMGARPQSVA